MQNLDKSIWIDNNNIIFQFQFTKGKIFNFDRPYLGVVIQYSTGNYYYADQKLIEVAIDIKGTIILPYMKSINVDENIIKWNDGSIWKKVNDIPEKNKIENIYHYAHNLATNNSNILYNKINNVYGEHPVVKGQILPM